MRLACILCYVGCAANIYTNGCILCYHCLLQEIEVAQYNTAQAADSWHVVFQQGCCSLAIHKPPGHIPLLLLFLLDSGTSPAAALLPRALEVYGLMLNQPGIHPDTTLYRNMIATFAACKAHQMVLQITLTMSNQGHSLDPATAAAAMDALQQQGAWGCAGQLLKSCYDAGAVMSHVVLERVLLTCANEGAWKAAREVLQVRFNVPIGCAPMLSNSSSYLLMSRCTPNRGGILCDQYF